MHQPFSPSTPRACGLARSVFWARTGSSPYASAAENRASSTWIAARTCHSRRRQSSWCRWRCRAEAARPRDSGSPGSCPVAYLGFSPTPPPMCLDVNLAPIRQVRAPSAPFPPTQPGVGPCRVHEQKPRRCPTWPRRRDVGTRRRCRLAAIRQGMATDDWPLVADRHQRHQAWCSFRCFRTWARISLWSKASLGGRARENQPTSAASSAACGSTASASTWAR